ncbi:hypothetical protein ACZ90_48775 [Streptomyces albus subsp. albus]|nr:hypothetical protein ACZ90_48775 [Streptomyces albus subsp. albus]
MVTARRAVLIAAVVLVAVGGVWGTGVTEDGVLSQGGLEDRSSESYRAMDRIRTEVGRQDADVLVLYTNPRGSVDQAAFRSEVAAALEAARHNEHVEHIDSYYDRGLPGPARAALVSKDKRATYAVVQLKGGDDDERMQSYTALKDTPGGNPLVVDGGGVHTELGGIRPMFDDLNSGIKDGAATIEFITIPALFILLLFVFRSVVAATVPIVVAVLALIGGLVLLRVLNEFTSISVFALNVLMFMALGLAVDYGLFMVSRFREELAQGHEVPRAIARTMQTAGRTVLVSGVTVTLALTGLLVFPQAYVRSMAFGGLVAVVLAMLASLTVLPAFLAVLGRKVDALRVPLPGDRRRAARAAQGSAAQGGWGKVAGQVMKHPFVITVGTVVGLVLLATPLLGVHFGTSDERALPKDAPSRVVAERLTDEFAIDARKSIYVLVSGAPGTGKQTVAKAQAFAEKIKGVPDIDPASVQLAAAKDRTVDGKPTTSVVVTATHHGEWTSEEARRVVGDIRALDRPEGTEVLVGGLAADLKDQLGSLRDHLPLMAGIIIVVTVLFMFLAFGSLLVPLMSVVLNIVSIAAAFGPIIWIFQHGHLSGLLDFTPTDFITAMEPVMMLAFAFGLSMDYSVFLLSRIREEWDRTQDAPHSVVAGVQRTGGIITSAAVLLAVTIGSFVLVGVKDLKFLAVGLFIIILLDATIVRMLLVPAILRLLGRAAWWAPGPMARFYAAYGVKEGGEPQDEPAHPAPVSAR